MQAPIYGEVNVFQLQACSPDVVVARVVSEHVVELHVVDLVGGSGLEALRNYGILCVGHPHLEVVEDGAEPGEVHETASALILVLEVGLDQQATVLDVCAESLEAGHEDTLLLIVEHVLGVEDRRCLERVESPLWVFLESLVGKDHLSVFAESHVVDETLVRWEGKVVLKAQVLLVSQIDLMRVKSASEFLSRDIALPQRIVVVEELKHADSILLDDVLDLEHQCVHCGSS